MTYIILAQKQSDDGSSFHREWRTAETNLEKGVAVHELLLDGWTVHLYSSIGLEYKIGEDK